MVGLTGLGRRYPHQLSGGQQQRVALARALATDPEMVLLDEPFSSLDASLRASVRSEVHDVLLQAGATSMLVTHDQDEALSMADHVAVLRHGVIAQLDSACRHLSAPLGPGAGPVAGRVQRPARHRQCRRGRRRRPTPPWARCRSKAGPRRGAARRRTEAWPTS